MTEYVVRATKAPNWQRNKDGILGISVGNLNQEGDKFKATVQWAARNFDRLHLMVADTLQRHNFVMGEKDALFHARKKGDIWLAEYKPIVEATGKLKSTKRWDDYITRPEFPEILAWFKQAAKENAQLRDAIKADVNRFLARQTTVRPDCAARSEAYILEELALFALYGREQVGARLYPSKNLESFKLVEALKIPGAPRGMENQQRVALEIRSRKPAYLTAEAA